MHENTVSNNQMSKAIVPGAKNWMTRIHKIMESTLYNSEFNNQNMARALEISERDLFRKIKKLTGHPPQKYFRNYRLQKAMDLMKRGEYRTVKEISNAIGYSNVSYFILLFEKKYSKKPLQILKEYGWR